jgi:diguanylate cyclase (GGDEF)-like protein
VRSDLENVLGTLNSIMHAPSKQIEPGTAHLLETSVIIDRINHLSLELADKHNQLEKESRHDPLTGLPNRRYLDEYLVRICNLVDRGVGIRLAIVDVDNFKQVNDRYGHQAGDEILKQFAYSIKGVLRAADFACRYAGDEFCVIFVELESSRKTMQALKRLNKEFDKTQKKHSVTAGQLVTLSIGTISIKPRSGPEPEDIIRKADEALYAAKDSGRNRIVDYATLLKNGHSLKLVENSKAAD